MKGEYIMTERIIKTGSFKKGEDAVSPVIGVILMVAITVILAAVIGAFVFSMGPGESAPTINFRAGSGTAGTTNTTVDLVVMGGDNVAISDLTFKIGGVSASNIGTDNTTAAGNTIKLTAVGTDTGASSVQVVDKGSNSVIFQAGINVV